MARGHFRLTGLPGSKVVLRSDIPVWLLPVLPLGSMTGSGFCRNSLAGRTLSESGQEGYGRRGRQNHSNQRTHTTSMRARFSPSVDVVGRR